MKGPTAAALALACCLAFAPRAARAQSDLGAQVAAAEAALRAGENQLAESRYRDVLLDAWLLLGAGHAADGDWLAARDAFERATRQALELRRPVMALAAVELQLGDVDAALMRLRQLQARRPDDQEVRRAMARALAAADRDEEAVQELAEAHAAAPDDPELAFYLATGYLKLDDFEAASRLFDEVLEARPIPETHVLLGRTWRDAQQYERARTSLRRALEMDPQVGKARFYLGTVDLQEHGRSGLEPAIGHFRDELEVSPGDPLDHLFLSVSLVELRRFEEALGYLDAAAGSAATRVDALQFRGRALLGLGRADEAVQALEQSLALAQDDPTTEGNQLGSIHYQLALALRKVGRGEEARSHFDAAEAELEGFTDETREKLRRYLEDAPGEPASGSSLLSASAVPTLGLETLSAEERAATLRGLGDVVARAELNLGILQSRGGRAERAADHFRVARDTAADPELARQATYSHGVALFQASRYDEALEPLESAWAASGGAGDDTLRRMLALSRLETEHWQGAAELLAEDDLRTSDPSLQFAYGKALVRSGRTEEALAVFDSLADEGSRRADLAVLFGQAHADDGDWPAAESSLRRALELDPQVAGAHTTLGEIFLRQGQLPQAESELRAELAARPDDRRSRYLLATVLDLAERHEEAAAEVRIVLDQRPDDADARYLLGKILFGREDYESAAAQLEAAARLAPDDANVHYQLAQSYQRLGRQEAAREAFDVYRKLQAQRRAQAGKDPAEKGEG